MNERKLNPMLSYDKEQDKPKLINDDAVFLCVEFIKNPDKELEDTHFEVDDLFREYMWEQGVASKTYPPVYSQEEVDEFVLKMIQECSKVEEDDLPPLGEIIKNKLGIDKEN